MWNTWEKRNLHPAVDILIIIFLFLFEFVVAYPGILFFTNLENFWYLIYLFFFLLYKWLWYGIPLFYICYSWVVLCVTVEESLDIFVVYMSIYDKLLIDWYIHSVYFQPLVPTDMCLFVYHLIQIVLDYTILRVKINLIGNTCNNFSCLVRWIEKLRSHGTTYPGPRSGLKQPISDGRGTLPSKFDAGLISCSVFLGIPSD